MMVENEKELDVLNFGNILYYMTEKEEKMTEKKKLFGEELAAKIIEEFDRIEEEAEGFEFPYTVTVHKDETEFGTEDVPGVKIHNDCEDPIFIPDSEGMTEKEVAAFAEGLAETFIGPRHEETRYYVVAEGEEEEEFDNFLDAARHAEWLFREKLIDAIKSEVDTHKFEKDESGNWKYKVYFDGDDSVFDEGPIIEKREKIWWGEEK